MRANVIIPSRCSGDGFLKESHKAVEGVLVHVINGR